jgi:hypothetical protein
MELLTEAAQRQPRQLHPKPSVSYFLSLFAFTHTQPNRQNTDILNYNRFNPTQRLF